MRVLVACEESQTVCKAFRARGHEAYSCDTEPCSGGKPYWHLQKDVKNIITSCWDLIIAHPPCTFLTSANTYIKRGCSKYTPSQALDLRKEAVDFFRMFTHLHKFGIKVCIENPVGIMSTLYKKPTQYIQPYDFGEDASKNTCLWLYGLPELKTTKYIEPRIVNGKKRWGNQTDSGQNKLPPSATRSRERSRTYQGVADAMAEQWS